MKLPITLSVILMILLGSLWHIPLTAYWPIYDNSSKNHTSQTVMSTRPLFQTDALFSGTWAEFITNQGKEGTCELVIEALGLYQNSVNNFCKSRGYFLMNCKPALLVAGDSSPLVLDRDIRSEFIGITDPDFEGILTVQPEQQEGGVILSCNQHLGAYFDWDFIKTWWVDVALPIFTVKNRLNTNGSAPEVVAGFNAADLCFARIDPCTSTKTGVGTIEIRVGGAFLYEDGFFLDYYSGIGIPAEGKPTARHLFPATLGNQNHLTLINGGHFKMPLICLCDDSCTLRFFLTIENRYYVSNHQMRTFDLQNKQFSRYLPVRRAGETATIPAANVLTFCISVHPNSFTNLSTGIELCGEHFTCDLGYRLWCHQGEGIRYERKCCEKRSPLFSQYGIAGTAPGASASLSTIANLAADDPVFIPIKESDINYCSGLASASLTQGFNIEFYYRKELAQKEMLCGLGGSWETPNNNSALQTWGVWLRLGSNF